MNFPKQGIWRLYVVLLVCGIIIMAIVLYSMWQNVFTRYTSKQVNEVKLASGTFISQLSMQEMMLSLLGKEFPKQKIFKKPARVPLVFDHFLRINNAITGLALLTPKGDFIYESGGIDLDKLPNLLQQPDSKNSFVYTLKKDGMVLGRTFYFEATKEWLIPVQKAIRNKAGNVVIVMSAVLSLQKTLSIFHKHIHTGKFSSITVVRDFDSYFQFYSLTKETKGFNYTEKAPKKIFQGILQIAGKKYQITIEDMRNSNKTYVCTHYNIKNERVLSAFKYDKRYELWFFCSVPYSLVLVEWFSGIAVYVAIFVILAIAFFGFFRFAAVSESRREILLIKQANTDSLTGLPNRNYLRNNTNQWINDMAVPFGLFYIDMDRFKNVNDSFGHQYGDNILIELTDRMKKTVDNGSVIIRQGGDEFLIFVYETDNKTLMDLAVRLIKSISRPYDVKGFNFVLGVSLGIAKYPDHADSMDVLIRAADIAMNEARKDRNTAKMFVPGMEEEILHKVELEQELRKAFFEEELFMVYQPQVDGKGKICGVEALVRWKNKRFGFVSPDMFIAIAESTGLICSLGDFIIKTALSEVASVRQATSGCPSVSINISVKQIVQTGFIDNLIAVIKQYESQNIRVVLEITESLFIEDLDYVLPLLKKISESGIAISLDDFGTGYSSLSVLRQLPINELKIDKSFVSDILIDKSAKGMIKNIIDIGKNLDVIVLAEGVETADQKEMLEFFGCDRYQGYYFAKPMRKDDLIEFIKKYQKSNYKKKSDHLNKT